MSHRRQEPEGNTDICWQKKRSLSIKDAPVIMNLKGGALDSLLSLFLPMSPHPLVKLSCQGLGAAGTAGGKGEAKETGCVPSAAAVLPCSVTEAWQLCEGPCCGG